MVASVRQQGWPGATVRGVLDSARKEQGPVISGSTKGAYEALRAWLRKQGVQATKPVHYLRKCFGSLAVGDHGIFIASKLLGHAGFTAYNESATRLFARWKAANTPRLRGLAQGGKPKALIGTLFEDLLAIFEKARLLDPYDVYQHLMDYWSETMQDDVDMMVSDGWRAAALRW